MSNLEQLGLYLQIISECKLITENDLQRDILNHIPRLSHCSFYLYTRMHLVGETNFPSRENLQQSSIDFSKQVVISYPDYFPQSLQCGYHLYSYPCQTEHFHDVSNLFPGGLFKHVRHVVLHDEYPFEHAFFRRICQSFPSMEVLTVINNQPQNRKTSDDDDRDSPVIHYSSLQMLQLDNVHDDYIEEFLLNTKTSFHQDIFLAIPYQSLQRVTLNFTRDATRNNCTKINQLDFFPESYCGHSLQEYFPNVRCACD